MSVNPKRRSRDKPRSDVPDVQQSQKSMVFDEPTTKDRKTQRKQILSFVSRTLELGLTGLRQQFASMRRFNDFEKMKAFKEAQEFGKNRYKDVGCLDNNRVKLASPWPHEYIHANYVATPTNPKRFICTQAPLEKTCADFWFMCLQERVENIFMLCNLLEKGTKKCHEYYPTKKNKTLEFVEGDQKITVKYDGESKFSFSGSSTAKVTATECVVEGPGGTLKTIHYHWNDWPDRGVPKADMAILELLDKARVSKGPIAVHCSAGIGRTGSVVMLEYVMDQLASGQTIEDGDKILVKIREQRNNSIQTDAQYIFVHLVLFNYFRKRKLLEDEKVKEEHDKLIKEFEKIKF
ncbi:unnamed protein product [Caenorhabditis sp. 36 PRJEB53466]|nr:unnamed protein product [Caenorhabditis sp. 36 PRJEB53466]